MAGMQRLGVALKALESLVPQLGSGSDAGKDVLKCIGMLAKHIQPGAVTPAAEKNTLQEQMMRNQQNTNMQQAMRQKMQQQQTPQQPAA
jgi:hypothetical protein